MRVIVLRHNWTDNTDKLDSFYNFNDNISTPTAHTRLIQSYFVCVEGECACSGQSASSSQSCA